MIEISRNLSKNDRLYGILTRQYLEKKPFFAHRFAHFFDFSSIQLDTRQMWTYYIDAMIELNRDGSRQAQFRRSLLGRAFKAAAETGHMSEEHYQKYIELLFSDLDANKAELIKVFEQAVVKYETSLRLWSMYFTYYLHRNDYENVRAVFRRAKKILGRKSIPLWRKYLTYLRMLPTGEQIAEFNRCMNEIVPLQHTEYNELKALIVTMHYKIATIARARKIYKAFIDSTPNCYEVHAAMADLEAKCVSFCGFSALRVFRST